MKQFGRRRFLEGSAAAALMKTGERFLPAEITAPLPKAFDTHIHLFDPARPGGIPWPKPEDSVLYKPALPERYRMLAEPLGIVGAIAVECSPLSSDNDWLLRTAANNKFIVGVIANLDPALAEFPAQLDRLKADPLFLGIRYGNLWGRNLGDRSKEQRFIDNLKLFARSGLVFESANPNPELIAALLQLTKQVPDLKIVVDHLPQAPPPTGLASRDAYMRNLRELSERPNVYVKGTEILRRLDGTVPLDLSTYRPWLDAIWKMFGEDRVLFGSDWPNSDSMAPFKPTLRIAQEYIQTRGKLAAERYLWRNSKAIYGWKARDDRQAEMLRSAQIPMS